MIRILVYVIVSISLIFIVSEIFKFLSSINGTNRQMLQDKSTFLERLLEYEIVDWPWKELNILSLDFQLNQTSRLFDSTYEGLFTSVFGEYLGVIIAKRYGHKHLILIRTLEDIFELKIDNNGKSTLSINDDKPYDLELTDNQISIKTSPQKSNQAISNNIELVREMGKAEVKVNGKLILTTNELESDNKSLERLISSVPDSMNDEDQRIVKFLLQFYLIWQELTN